MNTLNRSHGILMILLCLFLMPPLAAWWLHFHGSSWQGERTNRGRLLQGPVQVLAPAAANQARRWHLAYVPMKSCDQACVEALDRLARARLALGRHLYGIELCVLLPEGMQAPSQKRLAQFRAMDVQVKRMLQPSPLLMKPGQVWVLNEKGEGVLFYASPEQTQAIFSDLKQLSRLWTA